MTDIARSLPVRIRVDSDPDRRKRIGKVERWIKGDRRGYARRRESHNISWPRHQVYRERVR
jgi:hypothetical protein